MQCRGEGRCCFLRGSASFFFLWLRSARLSPMERSSGGEQGLTTCVYDCKPHSHHFHGIPCHLGTVAIYSAGSPRLLHRRRCSPIGHHLPFEPLLVASTLICFLQNSRKPFGTTVPHTKFPYAGRHMPTSRFLQCECLILDYVSHTNQKQESPYQEKERRDPY
jgi:hypothetical protein